MIQDLNPRASEIRRDNTTYAERVIGSITTTDATATAWGDAEFVPDTTTAGSVTVRYIIQGMQSDGSSLYSITSEASYTWPAGGPIVRRSAAAGVGTASANSYNTPRPSHTFDAANVRPTVTGKAGTTIVWTGSYRLVHYHSP